MKDEFEVKGYSSKIRQGFLDLCNEGKVEIYEIDEGTEEWEIYFKQRLVSQDVSKNIGEISVIALSKAKKCYSC